MKSLAVLLTLAGLTFSSTLPLTANVPYAETARVLLRGGDTMVVVDGPGIKSSLTHDALHALDTLTTWIDTTWLRTKISSSSSVQIPVGYGLLSFVATNPAVDLGYGTWAQIGAGDFIAGFSATDTAFSPVGKVGGSKTDTHPAVSAGTPVGTVSAIAESTNATDVAEGTPPYLGVDGKNRTHPAPTVTGYAMPAHQHGAASSLPPYIVAYIWKRVS